jgi:hypothetical protein
MLFKEALYTAAHMLGHPSKRFPSNSIEMIDYVQITFARDPKVRGKG